ncbi:MAG: tetratricopeptide repeat protein [Bacteroidia bacterium]
MSIKEVLSSKQGGQLLLLLVLAVGLNLNTLMNSYAYDDQVVLTSNTLVAKGFAGIPELMRTEYFSGFKGNTVVLSGARYRPLSLVFFAVEYQIFGANPFVSHLINVLLFALLIYLLYKLLSVYLFRFYNPWLTFLTCIVFVVHPIHTEIIANVKGRDELITFICLIASLITCCRFVQNKSGWNLVYSLAWFILALLCKETALCFIGVVPLALYFFYSFPVKRAVLNSMPFLIALTAYLSLRWMIVGFHQHTISDIGNSPYIFATVGQAMATKTYIILKYIALLFFPYPLSYDYGYNQIPYIGLGSIQFIISVLSLTVILVPAFFMIKGRSLYSFCILFFFISLSVGTNFLFDMGAPLAERILFQPSLAFSILTASLFLALYQRYRAQSIVMGGAVLVLFSLKTIARNKDWKDEATLFVADLASAPNSVRVNQNAAKVYLSNAIATTELRARKDNYRKAIACYWRGLHLAPDNQVMMRALELSYLDLMECYPDAKVFLDENKPDSSALTPEEFPIYLSSLLFQQGIVFQHQQDMPGAISYFRKAVEYNKQNRKAREKLRALDPENKDIGPF